MNLSFDTGAVIEGYRSKTQLARILTETWVARNMYCPRCGHTHITHFENNRPVAGFFCPACGNGYLSLHKSGCRAKIYAGGHIPIRARTASQAPTKPPHPTENPSATAIPARFRLYHIYGSREISNYTIKRKTRFSLLKSDLLDTSCCRIKT